MKETKVAILYICTGKYELFWKDFYASAQKNLLLEYQKHYFVFTDADLIEKETDESVTKLYQKKLGWPYDTLKRFEIFERIIDKLEKYDFIYFFNANALIVAPINKEIIPIEEDLVGVQHPCHWNNKKEDFIYERSSASLAYIEYKSGENYYMGSFNGGKAKAYIALIKTLADNIRKDEQNGIIAIWHDESHLNSYYLNRGVKVLSPSFAYPEEMDLPFEKKIVLRDKKKWGGHNLLRGIRDNKKKGITFLLNKLIKKIF